MWTTRTGSRRSGAANLAMGLASSTCGRVGVSFGVGSVVSSFRRCVCWWVEGKDRREEDERKEDEMEKRKIGRAKRIGKKKRGRESWISSSDDEAQYP